MYYWKIKDIKEFEKDFTDLGFKLIRSHEHKICEKRIDEKHKIRVYLKPKTSQRLWLDVLITENKGYATCVGIEVEPFIKDLIESGEAIKEESGE
jgi:hypothetical protein